MDDFSDSYNQPYGGYNNRQPNHDKQNGGQTGGSATNESSADRCGTFNCGYSGPYFGDEIKTNPTLEKIFEIVASPLMLIFNILYTLSVVAEVISNITAIYACVLSVLTTVGLWMLYSGAKKRKINASSVKLIRIPFMISAVVVLVMLGLFALILVIELVTDSVAILTFAEADVWYAIALCLIMLVVVVGLFVYFIFQMKAVNAVLKDGIGVIEGIPSMSKVSGKFAYVSMYISGALQVIGSACTMLILPTFINLIFADYLTEFAEIAAMFTFTVVSAVIIIIASVIVAAYYFIAGMLIKKYIGWRENDNMA